MAHQEHSQLFFTWLLALLLACGAARAQDLQPVPPLTAHVIDQTGTLDAIQLKALEDKLMAFEQAGGTQIAILIVATTLPEDDASFANRVGNEWKIGRKEIGDGVLIVVAKNDRKVRVEVAKTLEGAIPDLAAKRIIDEAITPQFRQGNFAAGLHAGVDRLIARIKGEALPPPSQRAANDGFDWMDLAIMLFIAVPVAGAALRGIFGRKLGSLITGGGIGAVAWLISTSLLVAAIAGFVALMFSLLSQWSPAAGPGPGRHRGRSGAPWIVGGYGGGGNWGSGGSWGGGGGGGGWGGSGGGGDFGGGGASGDW
ncbi:membrane protein [Ramlibacter tataouinensis]|uniref:Membrane protein n=2 Tax=Ramlibacter tataouinensis TaxID=94132 RepID=A0A127JZE9_9BURK|nr:membrane protein [Ramlibacter tataouinensis]